MGIFLAASKSLPFPSQRVAGPIGCHGPGRLPAVGVGNPDRPTATGASSWLGPASYWRCPSLSPPVKRSAQTALPNTAVRSAAKDACCWSRHSNRCARRLSFSSIVRNAMNRQAQRPVAQYSLNGGALALRPAPAFLRFGASLLGPGAPSTLARPPQNKLSEHSRRPPGARLRSPKNIQIPTRPQHRG